MNQEIYDECLAALPRLHPSHPYSVGMYEIRKGALVHVMHVRASSPDRAKLAAMFHYQANFGRSGARVRPGVPRPMMPVELNNYWDRKCPANPDGLKLEESKWRKELVLEMS